MRDFVCPRCGFVIHNDIAMQRKLCPTCAQERIKERQRAKAAVERTHNKGISIKQLTKAERAQREQEKQRLKLLEEALKKEDEKLDAKTREQMEQCRKCNYYNRDCGLEYCDYTSHTGELRTVENGEPVRYEAGQCGKFEPRKPRTKADRLARVRKSIFFSEANTASYADDIMCCSKTR